MLFYNNKYFSVANVRKVLKAISATRLTIRVTIRHAETTLNVLQHFYVIPEMLLLSAMKTFMNSSLANVRLSFMAKDVLSSQLQTSYLTLRNQTSTIT